MSHSRRTKRSFGSGAIFRTRASGVTASTNEDSKAFAVNRTSSDDGINIWKDVDPAKAADRRQEGDA